MYYAIHICVPNNWYICAIYAAERESRDVSCSVHKYECTSNHKISFILCDLYFFVSKLLYNFLSATYSFKRYSCLITYHLIEWLTTLYTYKGPAKKLHRNIVCFSFVDSWNCFLLNISCFILQNLFLVIPLYFNINICKIFFHSIMMYLYR